MRAERSPVLAMADLSKRYGSTVAVEGAELALHSGRIVCLLGPSGCGKSTLLRLVAGLERPDGGELRAGGRLLNGPGLFMPPEERRIGLVFQDLALFPHLTAAENVAFGLKAQPRAQRMKRARDLLDRFKLGHRADAWPHTLSGGEQQRVAIARALAPRPLALLLDEPFSGLDGELRAQVRESVISGLRDSDAAILVVTHDPEEAMLLGDELALMSGGRIIQAGPPEECYHRPSSIAAATLLGRINVLEAQVDGGSARCMLGDFAAPGLPDGPATLLVRPEFLTLEQSGTEIMVADVRFGGAYIETTFEKDGQKLVMRTRSPVARTGEKVRVAPVADQVRVIAREDQVRS